MNQTTTTERLDRPMPNTPGEIASHLVGSHGWSVERAVDKPMLLRGAHLNAHGLNGHPELVDGDLNHDHPVRPVARKGGKTFAEFGPATKFVTVALACFVVGGVIVSTASGNDRGSSTSGGSPGMAFEMCKDFVKARLKAPSTATFRNFYEDDGEVRVTGSGAGPYTIQSTVDSQNGFGAKIRSNFSCTVTATGDTWHASNVSVY
jgi:hypothetical protein